MATEPTIPPSGTNNIESPARLPGGISLLADRRKWAILVIGVLIIAIGVTYWRGRISAPVTTNSANPATTNTSTTKKNTAPTFQQVTVPIVADADRDGLTDDREAELKTNAKLADTDGDELSDYDEVTVYGTNPLVQDTDGDGFPDGAEVRSGNNPKGAGKIINLPESISTINAQ